MNQKINKDTKIAVLGLGLIGGSFIKSMKSSSFINIYGIDSDKQTVKKAYKQGYITNDIIPIEATIPFCDFMIICLYPRDMVDFIKENIELFKEDAIIIDTSGVKSNIVNAVQSILEIKRPDLEFLGCHPMAGREGSGFDISSKELFLGADFIITPTVKNSQMVIDNISDFATLIGFSRVIKTDPTAHDSILAYTSHLTHAISASFMNICPEEDISGYSAKSFKDLTRIAAINPYLWTELLLENNNEFVNITERFINELTKVKNAVSENDKDALIDFFKKSAEKKGKIK